jgi:serine/threonine-protein kinase HipA
MNDQKDIFIFADWAGLNSPTFIGTLYCSKLRGKEIYQFEYDKEWLKSTFALEIDPNLQLFSGRQYPQETSTNFGIFLDSMPDRWGKQLMLRREAIKARQENRKQQTLFGSDFLLGVDDNQRLGGLRFKLQKTGEFRNCDPEFKTPPWTLLRDLEYASFKYEGDKSQINPETIKWFNMLLAPGSSLGGARPKAGIKDPSDMLWIAKFPSTNDDIDVGGWEIVVNRLAQLSGLNVAKAQAIKLSSHHHTFLSKRFDRNDKDERIHFASAMTMLKHKDGDDFTTGVSYLEMIPFLLKYGVNPMADLEELWRRIAFSIVVKNTDDHLRNHGFLLTKKGWTLSPAYDINPNLYGNGLKLNISENDNSLDLDLALSVSEYFRIKTTNAENIINNIKHNLRHWKKIALEYQIPKGEIELMSEIFEPA